MCRRLRSQLVLPTLRRERNLRTRYTQTKSPLTKRTIGPSYHESLLRFNEPICPHRDGSSVPQDDTRDDFESVQSSRGHDDGDGSSLDRAERFGEHIRLEYADERSDGRHLQQCPNMAFSSRRFGCLHRLCADSGGTSPSEDSKIRHQCCPGCRRGRGIAFSVPDTIVDCCQPGAVSSVALLWNYLVGKFPFLTKRWQRNNDTEEGLREASTMCSHFASPCVT